MSGAGHYAISCMPLISNLLVLDAEGKRVAVKYFGETWCGTGSGTRRPPGCVLTGRACSGLPQAERGGADGVREDAVHQDVARQRPR